MTSKTTGGAGVSAKIQRLGIHAKTKISKLKSSKLYKKENRG